MTSYGSKCGITTRAQHPQYSFLADNAQPQSSHGEPSEIIKGRALIQHLSFKQKKGCSIQKCQCHNWKDSLRNSSRLKKSKETWQLNKMCDPRQDLILKGKWCYKCPEIHKWLWLFKKYPILRKCTLKNLGLARLMYAKYSLMIYIRLYLMYMLYICTYYIQRKREKEKTNKKSKC